MLVGLLGGEDGAVWAVRLVSSLDFVFVVFVVLRLMCWVVTERHKNNRTQQRPRE